MRILFLCSEYEGLIKTGGLADAARGLAKALVDAGHQVTVMLPQYADLYKIETHDWESVYFGLGGQQFGCAIRYLNIDGVDIALLENHELFRRKRPYDDGGYGYADNPLRFAVFCKAALEWYRQTAQQFDVIHGHDWQTGLAAYYLKQHYAADPVLGNIPYIYSIHNGAYQQVCSADWLSRLDVSPEHANPLNFLAIGIQYADKINTVSQGYRDELLHEPAANGLAGLYHYRRHDLVGILNGCDYHLWHPSSDKHLVANYNETDLSGKNICKKAILARYHFADTALPLYVAVSRITAQKGYDYLIPALRSWLPNVQANVIIVGTGEHHYCQQLGALQYDFPSKFRFLEGFDEVLAHELEAAGDFFLMPSLFEPCGLNQLYSLCYGTVPLVRLTGGLKDTVYPWPATEQPTGIGFHQPTVDALLEALYQSVELYRQSAIYAAVQQRGMQQNFSWPKAAAQYLELYQAAIDK